MPPCYLGWAGWTGIAVVSLPAESFSLPFGVCSPDVKVPSSVTFAFDVFTGASAEVADSLVSAVSFSSFVSLASVSWPGAVSGEDEALDCLSVDPGSESPLDSEPVLGELAGFGGAAAGTGGTAGGVGTALTGRARS